MDEMNERAASGHGAEQQHIQNCNHESTASHGVDEAQASLASDDGAESGIELVPCSLGKFRAAGANASNTSTCIF